MCGLTVLYHPAWSVERLRRHTGVALERLAHRGPDGHGIWNDAGVILGHRRLAIVDLAGSPQPMSDPTHRYHLVYNGEIYNHQSLRHALTPRWTFRTSGDTELLLAGLVLLGPAFLNRLEGMWALALWDGDSRTLLLARDRMGKKPLFYQHDAGQSAFSCASELPALAALTDTPWSRDEESTADFFRYGYPLPGFTAYREVRELLPGHWLRWRPGEAIEQGRYWSLSLTPFTGSRNEARERLRTALIRSVEQRLMADVEVGALLSGGVDSTLIVAILTRILHRSPRTFTLGFPVASFDESPMARRVATLFGTRHREARFDLEQMELLDRLLREQVGQPLADPSLLPVALVAKLAGEEVKVILSGDGGDELFCGYQRYQARVLLRWYTRLPLRLRRWGERLILSRPEGMAHHSHDWMKKAHLFLAAQRRLGDETPYFAPRLFDREGLTALLPELSHAGHAPPELPEVANHQELTRMMVADALIYLPQDILTKVDRASMAFSVESRCPFLDREVVELAFSWPASWHRRGFSGKRMLLESFPDLIPGFVRRRRKQGFAVPVAHWLKGVAGDRLLDRLQALDTPLNPEEVARLLAIHRSGRQDHGLRLWAIHAYVESLSHPGGPGAMLAPGGGLEATPPGF
ncbi:MAG: asparagine synthase (glutamine-hydrolyzing) [Magnetococcales bacterium]|nr:asparagine synthase (glutamine-hydrolyzing) [Magnetococcales bacterium]